MTVIKCGAGPVRDSVICLDGVAVNRLSFTNCVVGHRAGTVGTAWMKGEASMVSGAAMPATVTETGSRSRR